MSRRRPVVDFNGQIARPVAILALTEHLGIPSQDRKKVAQWATAYIGSRDPEEPDVRRRERLGFAALCYFDRQIAREAKQELHDTFGARLIQRAGSQHRPSRSELAAFLAGLIVAGTDTLTTSITLATRTLLSNETARRRVKANPQTRDRAVVELLRWTSPVSYACRVASRTAEVGGASIHAGERVALMYCAANRDRRRFAFPARLDVGRRSNPHLSFGFGPHVCLGAALARMTLRVFIEEWFEHRRRIYLDGETVRAQETLVPRVTRMPVRFVR